jgi:hypothetical protein
MWVFTVRPNMTSPVKASVMGVSNAEPGEGLVGAGVGDALLAEIAVLLVVLWDRLFAPQPAKPSRATPPAASTSRRVQFRFSPLKPSIFFMKPLYHKQTQLHACLFIR